MGTRRALDEADIRRRIDDHAQALCALDLEGAMSIYGADIVSFDVVAPLQYQGLPAKRRAWMDALATYRPPLRYEIRDPVITVGDDVAFSHSLNRVSGTLQNGRRSDFWLRWTACFRRIDGAWLIVHEQVSVPVDLASGKALLDLEP